MAKHCKQNFENNIKVNQAINHRAKTVGLILSLINHWNSSHLIELKVKR
jgi:hypothetical protein